MNSSITLSNFVFFQWICLLWCTKTPQFISLFKKSFNYKNSFEKSNLWNFCALRLLHVSSENYDLCAVCHRLRAVESKQSYLSSEGQGSVCWQELWPLSTALLVFHTLAAFSFISILKTPSWNDLFKIFMASIYSLLANNDRTNRKDSELQTEKMKELYFVWITFTCLSFGDEITKCTSQISMFIMK